jgi:hypothetical protein
MVVREKNAIDINTINPPPGTEKEESIASWQ